jgi:hypothetical protein
MRQVLRALARSAAVERWLIRGMIAATGLAMLATSEQTFFFDFSQTVAGLHIDLTEQRPSAVVQITATAMGLAPDGKPTTEGAIFRVRGTVGSGTATNGDAGGADVPRWLHVSIDTDASSAESPMAVPADFDLTRGMQFRGNCAAPGDPSAPCQAALRIHFEREDGGQGGGSLAVDWSLIFSARTFKNDKPDEDLPLPWQIEVIQP